MYTHDDEHYQRKRGTDSAERDGRKEMRSRVWLSSYHALFRPDWPMRDHIDWGEWTLPIFHCLSYRE